MTVQERLEYLRGEIEAERISYGEIAELQGLAEHIDPTDVVLLQWAGVPEFPDDGFPHDYGQYCDCPDCGGDGAADPAETLRDRYPGYAYDGRDGSLEDDGDDDRIAEQDRIMAGMREAR